MQPLVKYLISNCVGRQVGREGFGSRVASPQARSLNGPARALKAQKETGSSRLALPFTAGKRSRLRTCVVSPGARAEGVGGGCTGTHPVPAHRTAHPLGQEGGKWCCRHGGSGGGLNVPWGLITHHGIQVDQQFAHTGDQRDLRRFAFLDQMIKHGLQCGIPAHR